MKKKYFFIFILIFCIGFIYGLSVDYLEIFPYENLKNIKLLLSQDDLTNFKQPNNFNIESIINIKNQSDIQLKKEILVDYIWKNKVDLNSLYPDSIEKNYIDSRYNELENLKTISKFNITMDFDVKSTAYFFEPKSSNGELVIYHQGHKGDFFYGKKTIEELLNNDYSVLAFSMPLMGLNNQPTVDTTNFGPIFLNSHNKFHFLESKDFSPIKFFVEPIYSSLNYLDENNSFKKIHFVGISGGGWTGIIYSAIDERISNTFSIAGTLPIFLRIEIKDIGDYEQTNSNLYSKINYLEMYVLSSYGDERKTVLIYNKYDPCCFDGTNSLLIQKPIKKILDSLEKGNFQIVIDETGTKHEISDFSLDKILFLLK